MKIKKRKVLGEGMSNYGAGFGTGFVTGYLVGSDTGESRERARQRRMKVMGKDQILLKVKKSIDEAGEAIASTFSNWYYKDGRIYQKREYPFDFSGFIIAAFLVGLGLFIAWFVWCWDEIECNFPFSLRSGFLVTLFIGLCVGFRFGFEDEEVDYIRLTESNKHTLVLIKIYDEDGCRNIDDDQIQLILDNLKVRGC